MQCFRHVVHPQLPFAAHRLHLLEFLPLKTVDYAALICAAMSLIKANVLHARNSFVRGARRARWEIASMVIHSDASFPTPMA